MVNIIVAYDKNLAIGKDNTLVWRQSADLKRFKELTTGHTVVMGRKTYDSIGKPLPNRRNIVITRQDIKIDGVEIINSIDDIKNIKEDIFIIGGGEIYNQAIEKVDRMYITEVDAEFPNADTYFPAISNSWKPVYSEAVSTDEKHAFDFRFVVFERGSNI